MVGAQLILTALQAEAYPIIQNYEMEKISVPFPLYKKDKLYLSITGIGYKSIQESLPNILNYFESQALSHIYNIGVAGGNPHKTELGKIYGVNKVIRNPQDMIFDLGKQPLVELSYLSLESVEKSVTEWIKDYADLVDMEAWYIINILRTKSSIEQISILKIVSDFMDLSQRKLTLSDLENYIHNNLNVINSIIKKR